MLKATVQFFIRIEAPAKLAERIVRMLFSSEVNGPVFMTENLKSEAVSMEELMAKVILGRSVRRAGFERETAQFEAVANCVSPMAREGAVKKPKVFQVLNGASSSYCPNIN
jgi:chemotaxis methyl-accepting protein methylase